MSWYEVVKGGDLYQGDILRDCPIPDVQGLDGLPVEGADYEVDFDLVDACVMTQTCDLENKKVDEVLLARVTDWPAAVAAAVASGNTWVKAEEFRKSLVRGQVPNLSLLHKHEAAPELDWSIVDFHHLFVLPKSTVIGLAEQSGDRLRRTTPYREHLGQAFARYFMRVGLPHEAKDFVTEGATD